METTLQVLLLLISVMEVPNICPKALWFFINIWFQRMQNFRLNNRKVEKEKNIYLSRQNYLALPKST